MKACRPNGFYRDTSYNGRKMSFREICLSSRRAFSQSAHSALQLLCKWGPNYKIKILLPKVTEIQITFLTLFISAKCDELSA